MFDSFEFDFYYFLCYFLTSFDRERDLTTLFEISPLLAIFSFKYLN